MQSENYGGINWIASETFTGESQSAGERSGRKFVFNLVFLLKEDRTELAESKARNIAEIVGAAFAAMDDRIAAQSRFYSKNSRGKPRGI